MNRSWPAILLLSFSSLPVLAQSSDMDFDKVLRQGEQLLRQNIDDKWLQSLPQLDQAKVQQFLRNLQQRFQGKYVVDLAPLKQTAAVILPLLDRYQETHPYSAWLRSRIDYLDVADQLRLMIPPPAVNPNRPAPPPANPTPQLEKKVWQQHLQNRPAPKGAQAYVRELKPIFAAHGVPSQLVWLAEVESSFDPAAKSPVGAAGMYQLMPATAKENGLALQPQDERLQPEKNARAAADYLKHLHQRFHDWPLALAAYNAGEGRIQTLLSKSKTHTFPGIAVKLPAETQMYVPRVDATLARREGVTLIQLP